MISSLLVAFWLGAMFGGAVSFFFLLRAGKKAQDDGVLSVKSREVSPTPKNIRVTRTTLTKVDDIGFDAALLGELMNLAAMPLRIKVEGWNSPAAALLRDAAPRLLAAAKRDAEELASLREAYDLTLKDHAALEQDRDRIAKLLDAALHDTTEAERYVVLAEAVRALVAKRADCDVCGAPITCEGADPHGNPIGSCDNHRRRLGLDECEDAAEVRAIVALLSGAPSDYGQRVEAMRIALEPFASALEPWMADHGDDLTIAVRATFGRLRTAKAALDAMTKEGSGGR